MSSNPPIGNGQSPSKGDRVKAKHISDLNEKIKRLSRSADVNQNIATKFIEIPFDISVKIKEGTSNPYQYQISVSRGLVVEKRPSADDGVDALIYWEASNALTDDEPTWFDIGHNESIFAVVTETNTGTIRPISSVELEVLSSSTISTAYIPGSQAGYYTYEIAKFTIVDERPVVDKFISGSHIFHEVTTTGWWGACEFLFTPGGGGGSPSRLIQTFENGILVSVSLDASYIDGTVETPGNVEWEVQP